MIYLASDHNGVEKMKYVKKWLTENGFEWESVGADVYDKTDNYVTYVLKANELVKKEGNFGIYMCGTGIGVSMAANRTKGIRAVLCNMEETAYFSRLHNNANVICFSAGYEGYPRFCKQKMMRCIKTFITTKFEGGRHIARVVDLDEKF